jgi:two-component system, chemotaxis family, sensor kinase CheA
MHDDNKTNNSSLHFAEEAIRALDHHDGTCALKDLPIWLPLIQELDACRGAAQVLGIETLTDLCQKLSQHLGPIQSDLFELGPSAIQTLIKDLNTWVTTRRSIAAFGLMLLDNNHVAPPKTTAAPARTKTFISDMSKYLPLFVEETEEGFEIMQTHFLAIETGVKRSGFLPSPDLVNELFRHAHKIKASAGAMGFSSLSELTHTMETLLDQIRNNRLRITPDLVSALLLALDRMRGEVETAKQGNIPNGNLSDALASLQWYLDKPADDGITHQNPSPTIPADLLEEVATPHEREEATAALQRGLFTFKVSIEIDPEVPAPEMRLMLAAKHLSEFGSLLSPSSPIATLDSQNELRKLNFLFQTKQAEAAIRDCLLSIEITSVQTHLLAERETNPSPVAPPSQSIRVSTDSLDSLMNLSGELAISKNNFIAVSEQLRARGRAADSVGTALEESIQQLAVLTTGIQQLVLEMRMVPISPLFERCRRIVRDLAVSLDKKIDLVLIGAETSLDKKIIDQLGDPLNHMVRNSVDHGIESAEERKAAGKPPLGTITVRAEREGSRICITISDDGKGIPVETIRSRVVELGLVATGVAAEMKPDQLIKFIFHPGLSTAQKVTSISGRGVGMDIVRKRIEEINGTVEVRSTEGRGATFRILLPLTVVSQTCLLFEFQKTIFASALQNVSEILRVEPAKVAQMRFGNYLRIREELVPLFDFTHFFKKSFFIESLLKSQAPLSVVVLKTGSQRIAVAVDRLLGEEEVIVKSMGPLVGDIDGLAGVSLLSSGGVALILDVEYLVGKTAPSKEVAHEPHFTQTASPS